MRSGGTRDRWLNGWRNEEDVQQNKRKKLLLTTVFLRTNVSTTA